MAGAAGFEPATSRFGAERSTSWTYAPVLDWRGRVESNHLLLVCPVHLAPMGESRAKEPMCFRTGFGDPLPTVGIVPRNVL